MIDSQMLSEQRLREVLAAIPGVETVLIHEDERRWVARVLASRFETMDEAERQAEIYNVLLRELSSDELRRVAFVFTDTPAEYAAPLDVAD
ncbi:MAG TPA: hypothetical protein VG755_28105 [Nannocystaceae bacterium]|nr:hypothetical protein [Nannocystaceae bacterium]